MFDDDPRFQELRRIREAVRGPGDGGVAADHLLAWRVRMNEQVAAAQEVEKRATAARQAVEQWKRTREGESDAVIFCTVDLGKALAARDDVWPVHPIDAYKRGYQYLTGKQHP